MESSKTKHSLTPILLVILVSMLFSCSKETKKEPQKIYDVPENMQTAQNSADIRSQVANSIADSSPSLGRKDYPLVISGENTSSFRLDDRVIHPEKTEGYIKNTEGFRKVNVASYTGSEGYFFELLIPLDKDVVGSHDLDKNGNRLLLNHKENGLLTVYGSRFCEGKSGEITIEAYDEAKHIISGSFAAVVCNQGVIGRKGKKTVQICRFKDVKLLRL